VFFAKLNSGTSNAVEVVLNAQFSNLYGAIFRDFTTPLPNFKKPLQLRYHALIMNDCNLKTELKLLMRLSVSNKNVQWS
jgi:hypothetical protein